MTTSKENSVTNLSTVAVSGNEIKNHNTSSTAVCRMLKPSEIKDLQQNKRESIQKMRELLDGNVFL